MTRSLFFLSALSVLCASTPAAAQSGPPAPATESGVRLGPLRFAPHVEFRNVGVDSNVFNAVGEQTPDFTFTLAPSLDTTLKFARRGRVSVHSGTDLVYFAKYSDQRSIDPNVSLRAEGYLRRVTIWIGAGYNRTRQRTNQDLDVRARRNVRAQSAGATFDLTPKLSLGVTVSGTSEEFDARTVVTGISLQQSLNRNAQAFGVTGRYQVTPYTALVAEFDRERDRFPFASLKNADTVKFLPGVEFKPRALISGRFAAGFKSFVPRVPTVPTFRGPVVDTSLSYTLLGSTKFTAQFGRDTAYSYEILQPYFLSTTIGGIVRRELVRSYDIQLDAQRVSNAYRWFFESTSPQRVDVTRMIQISLGYRIAKDTRLGIGLSRWSRDSTTRADRTYTAIRFGAFVTYGV